MALCEQSVYFFSFLLPEKDEEIQEVTERKAAAIDAAVAVFFGTGLYFHIIHIAVKAFLSFLLAGKPIIMQGNALQHFLGRTSNDGVKIGSQ